MTTQLGFRGIDIALPPRTIDLPLYPFYRQLNAAQPIREERAVVMNSSVDLPSKKPIKSKRMQFGQHNNLYTLYAELQYLVEAISESDDQRIGINDKPLDFSRVMTAFHLVTGHRSNLPNVPKEKFYHLVAEFLVQLVCHCIDKKDKDGLFSALSIANGFADYFAQHHPDKNFHSNFIDSIERHLVASPHALENNVFSAVHLAGRSAWGDGLSDDQM